MMRGMFAAISGLKTHQVMLDVTANDIANVNTIGYKSARTTFKDSLTQLAARRLRARRRHGRRERGPDRPRRPARLDRQPDDRRRAPVDGQPARRRDPGPGLLPRRLEHRRRPPTANPAATEYTRAGNFTTNSQGYLVTQDGYYVQGRDRRRRRHR